MSGRMVLPRCLAGAAVVWAVAGCLEEKSFPLRHQDVVWITPPAEVAEGDGHDLSARQWVVHAHGELQRLLPPKGRTALVTEDLSDGHGHAVDVYARLDKPKEHLKLLFKNFNALVHSTQAAAPGYAIETPAPPWAGFEDVWIPVAEGVELCGRLGFAREAGRIRRADCIILLPGIWGDNGVLRSRDLAMALRDEGLHVLSLEIRGHGQTEARFPDLYYTFGVLEAMDLLRVADWLEDSYPEIRGTGVIGFCWGSNIALLATWLDACGGRHPAIADTVARHLGPITPRPRFTAGILAFSTVVDWESIIEQAEQPARWSKNPPIHALQRVVRDRMRLKKHPEDSGNLRRLIEYEFAASSLTAEFPIMDGYRYLRFVSHRDLPWDNKLDAIRVPVVLVHAVNDPFTMAQAVADLLATSDNPNVAGLILRGGGHIGFWPYNQAYSYSLILNFFDPLRGVQGRADRDKQAPSPS